MSKIILGIKDDNKPMHILGFEGNYSIKDEWVEDPLSFHYYYRGWEHKITLETNGAITEFDSSKEALNSIYGGRSGYLRELTALSFLEKSLGSKDEVKISKVISHEPATIVFWKDGTKTVVKCQEGDTYDLEKGILYSIIRKVYGEGRNYTNILNIINESCETYDHTKANEAFWNCVKEENNG